MTRNEFFAAHPNRLGMSVGEFSDLWARMVLALDVGSLADGTFQHSFLHLQHQVAPAWWSEFS